MNNEEYYFELHRVVKKNTDELDCYHLLVGGAPEDDLHRIYG